MKDGRPRSLNHSQTADDDVRPSEQCYVCLQSALNQPLVVYLPKRLMSKKIAFIGLGIMGLPMAGHLLAAGHSVVVHSRTKSRAVDILAKGATWADSPAAAAKDAEAVFICVTDTPDVQKVVLGDDGILHQMKPGQVIRVEIPGVGTLENRYEA